MPSIATTASGSGPLGGMVGDEAVLSGGSGEGGSILFELFGPGDPMCTGTPVFSSSVTVAGDGSYASEPFWPSAPGTYSFVAAYSGDAANAPASTLCGDGSEEVTMRPATPTLVTTASGAVLVGGQVSDAALLFGGYAEGGTITFDLFGPDDPMCSLAPVFTQRVPIVYGGRYSSSPFTVTQPGTYRFMAAYSGDANNAPVAGACGEQGETVNVRAELARATLTARASAAATVGEPIRAAVALSAPGNPTGTITFSIYGPSDATCSGPALTASTTTVNGSGNYVSDPPYVATMVGVYRFVASYSGDASVGGAASACAEPAAGIAVEPVPAPVLAKTFSVERVSGEVLVRPPAAGAGSARVADASEMAGALHIGGAVHVAGVGHIGGISHVVDAPHIGYVEVTTPQSFPVGSIVDTRGGTARVTTASNAHGGTQRGVFVGGPFRVLQNRDGGGLTVLKLLDGASAAGSCARRPRGARIAGRALPPRVIARLHSHVEGRFRTDGRYSSASVHGTIWDTVDRCDGTLTRVDRGVVEVFDHRRHRSVVLHAGMHYLARAP